jgi:ribosomal protein S18 acetylase RimI-like enzyme
MTTAVPRVALAIPSGLAALGFALRAEIEADILFLRRLYVSTRWEELAIADWTEAQKIAFLESQFAAQRRHYLAYHASAAFDVLEAAGSPAGRLYLDRGPDDLLIVDISLLPEWRGRGIGTALIRAVFAEASAAGKGVTISVEKFNPAQGLYRRLGFREYAEDGVYWFMRWRPHPEESAGVS